MKTRILLSVASTLCLLSAARADAQSIGIFFDPDGATCSRIQLANTQGTFYVIAILNGPASGGITGAELQVTGFPAAWFGNPSASPQAAFAFPSPLTNFGVVAFPTCQTGTNGMVLLWTVTYFATSLVGPTYLTVAGISPPGNPSFACPVVTLCDYPNYTKLCVRGGQGILNGAPCTISVTATTWSRIKEMYH